ncbi:MAG TPA: alpha/beta fold hydrolase [Haliangium sp.]|nr:alpha/beta fold hydrolase [Haliangium sp.]
MSALHLVAPTGSRTTSSTTRYAALGTALAIIAAGLASGGDAQALTCGTNDGLRCTGTATQYAGGFSPGVGFGGFGGGTCTATKTPVIFVHGNADRAISWDMPPANVSGYATAPNSVYDELRARGYNDCELFGITWLSASEQSDSGAANNYHRPEKYQLLATFIDRVKAYTGKTQVDIVGHSMGVSLALATIRQHGMQSSVRRFIGIAGGLRGLNSCYYTGYANAAAPTCGSQNAFDSSIFGFFPEGFYYGVFITNQWTGTGTTRSMRQFPGNFASTSYYTIRAGNRDQVLCATSSFFSNCASAALFSTYTNVKAQLDVGAGQSAGSYDWDWADGSPTNMAGGDKAGGVGHFKSKTNTGRIIYNMLDTLCTGTGCATGYVYGPVIN